jgi:hypothetical protein
MEPSSTRLPRDWRQLPFIIVGGLLIGLIIGEAVAAFATSSFAQHSNMKLYNAAKRAG